MRKMKRAVCAVCCLILSLFSYTSCKNDAKYKTFYYMDTLITVTLYDTDSKTAERVFSECETILKDTEDLWSRTRDGEITALCRDGVLSDPDGRTTALLQKAMEISEYSGGAFDVTVAPLKELWESAAKENRLPAEEELHTALGKIGYRRVTVNDTEIRLDPDTRIDLGGIGKGAAAELLIRALEESGVGGGYVSFGSNVAMFGEKPDKKPFRTSLRDPKNTSGTVGVLTLAPGEILSVSGDYERYYEIGGERYHHIFDPATGYPADTGLSSVAVICRDGAAADALSTALFVMGEERAMALYRSGTVAFEAVFIRQDGSIGTTGGLSGNFVPNGTD